MESLLYWLPGTILGVVLVVVWMGATPMTCARCSVAQDVQLCPFCNLALCPRCIDRHHCTGKGRP